MTATSNPPAASNAPDRPKNVHRHIPLSIVAALAFFCVVFYLGFPKPYVDDLFYIGAGLNLAHGGDYSNPLLARQGFPGHYFFVYPPLHSYALYAWLSVFGISTKSLLAFQNLMYFIIAACMILVLRRHRATPFLCWLLPLAVTAVFLRAGLRPEAFAVALTMAGYTALVYFPANTVLACVSFGLIFLGASAGPRIALFAFVLAGVGGWQWQQQRADVNRTRLFLLLALAAAIAGLVFLALIHFNLREFIQVFLFHSTRAQPPYKFLLHVGTHWFLLFGLTALLLFLTALRPATNASRLCYCLAAAFPLAGVAGLLGPGSSFYSIFILFLLTNVVAGEYPVKWRVTLYAVIAASVIFANGSKIVELYGEWTGNIVSTPPANRQALLSLESTPEHTILADAGTARYLYDYNIPSGVLDYNFGSPFPHYKPTDVVLRDGDIYLINAGAVGMLNKAEHTNYPVDLWTDRWSGLTCFKYPSKIYEIHAADLPHPAKQ